MKAIVIREFGPPDVLKYEEAAEPVLSRGEIRIAVRAASVNRVLDVSVRAGKQNHRGIRLPLTPGVDCAGIVTALGEGVTRFKLGDHVVVGGQVPLEPCAEDGAGYAGPYGMMGIHR
jgi:NADPH2:quinone reductase